MPHSESGSPLREMLRDATGVPYSPLSSLDDAQRAADGYVVLEGDDGGMVYVVAPARRVHIDARALEALLRELDEIAWSGGQPDMRRIYFEKRSAGVVPGGMGGGVASSEVWVHREFQERGLAPVIISVLEGRRASVAGLNV